MALGDKNDDAKYKMMHVFWKLLNEDKCTCFQCAIDSVLKKMRSGGGSGI